MPNYPVRIGSSTCGRQHPMLLIAGPCVLEDEAAAIEIAEHLARITGSMEVSLIFKASFDKANRTSCKSYRGPGLDRGLKILDRVRTVTGLAVTTDIHQPCQAAPAGEVCQLLQIPAFLARQTDLLTAAATTGKAVNVKKAQFLSPADMRHVVHKLEEAGCHDILLSERGTFFGYGKLVNDMRSIPQMQSLGVPVIFDATHSVQEPGGMGSTTGGNRAMVEPLARAAMALGAEGLFCETHPDPEQSPSDGPNMVPLAEMEGLLQRLLTIRTTVSSLDELRDER
jgi:2-dehydro-3-deoxyphosphooctonate aldolase (KDO 8-P synthase)